MITKSGMLALKEKFEKDAWIADVLSEKTLRGAGKLLRTSSKALGHLYRGARYAGRGFGRAARTGAVGLERVADAMRRYPLRTTAIGIPIIYGSSRLNSSLDRNINNIHPNNPYMHA